MLSSYSREALKKASTATLTIGAFEGRGHPPREAILND
jgi:hypothetical protein